MSLYNQDFYINRHQRTKYAAETVLSIVLETIPSVNSAVDFGCGVGTWLSVLKDNGATRIKGYDGPWVDQNLLEIDKQEFQEVVLENEVSLDGHYDLAISLEVIEHLSKRAGERLIDYLIRSSDFVLFSAAIPFQGGVGHINEQWQDHWVELFSQKDYKPFDIVRKKIWHDQQIPFWYKQNILLFVKKEQIQNIQSHVPEDFTDRQTFSMVHPEQYIETINYMQGVKPSFRLFANAVKQWVKNKVRS